MFYQILSKKSIDLKNIAKQISAASTNMNVSMMIGFYIRHEFLQTRLPKGCLFREPEFLNKRNCSQ
jgi:hypothetical protein